MIVQKYSIRELFLVENVCTHTKSLSNVSNICFFVFFFFNFSSYISHVYTKPTWSSKAKGKYICLHIFLGRRSKILFKNYTNNIICGNVAPTVKKTRIIHNYIEPPWVGRRQQRVCRSHRIWMRNDGEKKTRLQRTVYRQLPYTHEKKH